MVVEACLEVLHIHYLQLLLPNKTTGHRVVGPLVGRLRMPTATAKSRPRAIVDGNPLQHNY